MDEVKPIEPIKRMPRQRQRPAPAVRMLNRVMRRVDLYHRLLTMPWTGFFALLAAAYVAFNAIFALLYRLQDGSIAESGRSFANAFFFSVQTMATIGYGEMRPATLYANLLVSAEVLLGLLGFALATGVIFARFSRPTARVMFSQVAVVTRHDGKPTLMFRAANQRANRILEAQVSLTLARNEVTAEGDQMRRFHNLAVERSRTPLFVLSWSVMHVIDASSPLHGASSDSLAAQQAQAIVTIIGLDETLSQTIHARHVYDAADILFGRRLADILTRGLGPTPVVDYSRFHDTVE
ncbi:MAG TPA: ion channel [Stellaceae bacterium]|nr:ion channel [Stellaceae bacterium]